MVKDEIINFKVQGMPKHSIIKVIGVGGGGCNAVEYMYKQGISDVSFAVCNTDSKALEACKVPYHLQLGEGLGAGSDPAKGSEAAEKSVEDVKKMLDDGTRMVFITAGMGGGTGTGAGPVIAREAKSMGILTVGIVTIPFRFEGNPRIDQALDGVERIAKNVDALLVINNERLRDIYPNFTLLEAFDKANDTLNIAARSIADIITVKGEINLDFNDVCTVLKDGGIAIMSTAYGEGENRVTRAFEEALQSPLFNNNDIYKSKKMLFCITCSDKKEETLEMDEMNEVDEFMAKFTKNIGMKWGLVRESSIGDKIKISILASGFNIKDSLDEDSLDEIAIKEEKEERRKSYYGEADTQRCSHDLRLYTFTSGTLDDDDVISMLESSPTYSRSIKALQALQTHKKDQVSNIKAQEAKTAIDTIVFEKESSSQEIL